MNYSDKHSNKTVCVYLGVYFGLCLETILRK